MDQQRVVHTSHAHNVRGMKFNPTTDFNFNLEAAKKSGDFSSWARLFGRTWSNLGAISARQLYELVQHCPISFADNAHNLRVELIERYRDELLSQLNTENIGLMTKKWNTLLQLANFVGRDAYLKEQALTLAAFHEANLPLPKDIKDRIAACEKWNKVHGGRYTEAELLGAGFTIKKTDPHYKIFFHPLSHESLTIYAKDNLSPEDKAKVRALRENARVARQMERSHNPNKGTSAPKQKEHKGGKNK